MQKPALSQVPGASPRAWLAARQQELLASSYFRVVFTVPHELNVLALGNPSLLYDLLFTASARTLLAIEQTFAQDALSDHTRCAKKNHLHV